jgi:ubiquinone/menaquinone biosynthesis C-methylase UbiE
LSQFNQLVEFFDRQERSTWQMELATTLFEKASLRPGMRVLDAGCGAGWLLLGWAHRIPLEAVGIDNSGPMIERAQFNALQMQQRTHFEVADMRRLQWPNDSFDRIVSNFVFFLFDSPASTLTEVWRVLKPGGRFLMFNPGLNCLKDHMDSYAELRGWQEFDRDSFLQWGDVVSRRRRLTPEDIESWWGNTSAVFSHQTLWNGIGLLTEAVKPLAQVED